jgi:quinol monooxygenase YgiN
MIYQLAHYQVKPSAVDKVKTAIQEFVAYLETAEPGARLYWAWQQQDDPTRFVHIFEFADEAAHERHGQSEAVRRFEAVYTPELVSQGVEFVDYNWIAGKQTRG